MIVSAGIATDETRDMLLELLQHVYGFDVRISEITIVNQHVDYAALLVNLEKPTLRLAIKLAGRDAPYSYPFDRTAYWHQLVAERTSIPMPEIIGVDVSYQNYPWRYLIKSYLPGEEWATIRPMLNGGDLQKAYELIGKAIAELHTITFEDFGDIDNGKIASITHDFYRMLVDRVNASLRDNTIKQDFLRLLETNKSLFANVKQARLCHEDLHPHNILFQRTDSKWKLATILDFDKAWAGHYEIDLAKMAFWDGMTGDGFWKTYQAQMNIDDLYLQRQPIYQLWWCLEYAANTPKHLADTRRLCESLRFPLIERFE
jgi:aminoglycoside phosphotransferase (APT) family kinase protein